MISIGLHLGASSGEVSATANPGREIDPGAMEHWDIGNTAMPPAGPNSINSGEMEHWQAGCMPTVWTVV